MRLLHVVHSVDLRGGGPIEALRQRAKVLQQAGHAIEVVTLDRPDRREAAAEFAPTHYLGERASVYGYSASLVPWLQKNAAGFDAVTVHGLWQYQSFGTWRALRAQQSPPYFIFPHGMLDPWFKRTYPLKHLKKWLYWPWAEFRALRDARAVIFTCEEERRLARQSFWPYRCDEFVTNYGTAAPEGDPLRQRAAFAARFPELTGKRCLLFLGRVHVKKAPELMFQAFTEVLRSMPASVTENLHIVVAGPNDHAYGRKMVELTQALGIADRVTWTGMIQGDLKWGAFRSADAFILPSHQENFGIAVVEALACSLPVLISNQVNIWREIQTDRAGFVEIDDLPGTCHLLQRWLTCAPQEWAAMRVNAKGSFDRRFHIDQAALGLVRAMELFGLVKPDGQREKVSGEG